jgi:hypothetical protein
MDEKPRWFIAVPIGLAASLLAVAPAAAKVKISLCGPDCLCIEYDEDFGTHIEVRCNLSGGGGGEGGWTTIEPGPNEPAPDGPGSFGGDGDPGEETTPAPCNPVPVARQPKLNSAISSAKTRLTRVGPPENRQPTTCTTLFRNSPLGMPGLTLLDPNAPFHAIFRYGENCTLPNGDQPCNSGVAAAATCCTHSPYVYICDAFDNRTTTEAALLLIHELLHVAGQKEDTTTSAGPGDPPTTNQLNDVVRAACLNPTVIPLD